MFCVWALLICQDVSSRHLFLNLLGYLGSCVIQDIWIIHGMCNFTFCCNDHDDTVQMLRCRCDSYMRRWAWLPKQTGWLFSNNRFEPFFFIKFSEEMYFHSVLLGLATLLLSFFSLGHGQFGSECSANVLALLGFGQFGSGHLCQCSCTARVCILQRRL